MAFTAYVYMKSGLVARVDGCTDITEEAYTYENGFYRDIFTNYGYVMQPVTGAPSMVQTGPLGLVGMIGDLTVTYTAPITSDATATDGSAQYTHYYHLSDDVAHKALRQRSYKRHRIKFTISPAVTGPPGLFFWSDEVAGVTNMGPVSI